MNGKLSLFSQFNILTIAILRRTLICIGCTLMLPILDVNYPKRVF